MNLIFAAPPFILPVWSETPAIGIDSVIVDEEKKKYRAQALVICTEATAILHHRRCAWEQVAGIFLFLP